jgi:hypothetical protein
MRAPNAHTSRSRRLRRPVPSLYSRASHSFSRSALERDGCNDPIARCACVARATRATHTQTPITSAHFPIEFLYQFGVQSVQTFGRQCWIGGAVRMFARAARPSMRTRDRRPPLILPIGQISVCTNVGPNHTSRLAAYAVCVVLCARLRALRRINAHSRSPTPITYSHCPYEGLYEFGPRTTQPFGRM